MKMPEHYKWLNPQNLYRKSYCPLYPGIPKVIFALIDELCDAFDSNVIHAGMNEVLYQSRLLSALRRKNPAALFAREVTWIRNTWRKGEAVVDMG